MWSEEVIVSLFFFCEIVKSLVLWGYFNRFNWFGYLEVFCCVCLWFGGLIEIDWMVLLFDLFSDYYVLMENYS